MRAYCYMYIINKAGRKHIAAYYATTRLLSFLLGTRDTLVIGLAVRSWPGPQQNPSQKKECAERMCWS